MHCLRRLASRALVSPGSSPWRRAAAATPLAVDGRLDQFGHAGQAEKYALARPRYPPELLALVRSASGPCRLSLDVGCGSGQVTLDVAAWSDSVIGIDRSQEQLRVAAAHERVTYQAGDAYALPAEAGSVDLVTIAQAMHWLDLPRFFTEVKRVLRPGGTFAIMGYGVPQLGDATMERHFKRYYFETLGSGKQPGEAGCYWDISRPLLDTGFAETPFPFESVSRHWIDDRRETALDSFGAYLQSYSAYQTYIKVCDDPLPALLAELSDAAGNRAAVDVTIPFFLITCCTSP